MPTRTPSLGEYVKVFDWYKSHKPKVAVVTNVNAEGEIDVTVFTNNEHHPLAVLHRLPYRSESSPKGPHWFFPGESE